MTPKTDDDAAPAVSLRPRRPHVTEDVHDRAATVTRPPQPSEDELAVATALGLDFAALLDLLPADPWRPTAPEPGDVEDGLPADVLWLGAGNPVLVLLGAAPSTGEAVIAVPKVTWHRHTPVIGVARQKRHRLDDTLEAWLATEIATTRAAREATFMDCARCGQPTPPEWMFDAEICQSCAERDGVVF